jgi:hypothetical protein
MVNGDSHGTTYHTKKIKMSKQRVMILIVALLLAAVYLARAGSALATSPEEIMIPTSGSFILAECADIDVIDEYAGMAMITEF